MKPENNICRPLLKNYGNPKPGEKVVDCGECGEKCIKRPYLEDKARKFFKIIGVMCTKCAIKKYYIMNYIQKVQNLLEEELKMRGTPYEGLLEVYGLLVLTVGEKCTNENVHDAWSIWQNKTKSQHRSIKWFKDLTKTVQDLDEPYRKAIVKVSKLLIR